VPAWVDRIHKAGSVQVNSKLRRGTDRLFHWCPGCRGMHSLFYDRGWTFDGNLEKPTFTPSFLHDESNPERRCHYILTAGVLNFCTDCHHDLKGQSVSLPDLPVWMRDT
jgi:Family of unknown function (DUF6527)